MIRRGADDLRYRTARVACALGAGPATQATPRCGGMAWPRAGASPAGRTGREFSPGGSGKGWPAALARAVLGSVFLFAVAGGDLFRGHRQPGHRGRGSAADDLAQQHGHGVLRVIGQRPVQRDVGQGSLTGLPGHEGEQSSVSGHGTCLREPQNVSDPQERHRPAERHPTILRSLPHAGRGRRR